MNELQKKIFDIMTKIHEICVKNDIQYSLCGGSMIGAVREHGFIPWDDDMDIFMTMANYNKFIEVMREVKDDKFEVLIPFVTPNYFYPFVKVVDKTTTLLESYFEDYPDAVMGVYLDVFPLIEVKKPKDIIRLNRNRGFWYKLRRMKFKKHDFTLKEKIVWILSRLTSFDFLNKKLASYIKQDKGYSYVYDPDGYNDKSCVPKEWFTEFVLVPFENSEFYVIKNYDKYLTQIFGNYMERPPLEKQVSLHGYKFMDLNMPYKDYLLKSNEE